MRGFLSLGDRVSGIDTAVWLPGEWKKLNVFESEDGQLSAKSIKRDSWSAPLQLPKARLVSLKQSGAAAGQARATPLDPVPGLD